MKMYNCFVTVNKRDKASFVVCVMADSEYLASIDAYNWCVEHFKQSPFNIEIQSVFDMEFE